MGDGCFAVKLGAETIINQRVDSLLSDPDHISSVNRFIVKESSGRERPLATIGEFIQLKEPARFHPSLVPALINELLPRGLCFGMELYYAPLTQLGLQRVDFVRYAFKG